MRTCKSLLLVLGIVLGFMLAATAAHAPSLTFKFTKVNVPGAIATAPVYQLTRTSYSAS